MKVLLENGADVNAVNKDNKTAIHSAISKNHNTCVLQLLCFGAEIDKGAIRNDHSVLIVGIDERLELLRAGKRIGTSLMSNEERRFMWNLAFSFTIAHRGAAFKAYYAIRSFITYHGIFMASGYELGEDKIWKRAEKVCRNWRKMYGRS